VKPYILFEGFAATKFLRKRSTWRISPFYRALKVSEPTKLIFRTRLELFVRRELFDAAGEGLHVVDNQLIEI